MEKHVVITPQVDPVAHELFYRLIGQLPETEAAWADRQTTLRVWRSDTRFEPYWPSIEHMLSDDFGSLQRRAALAAVGDLAGYDCDAWREQRAYDLKHPRDHLS